MEDNQHGGKRDGAGRKPGSFNLIKKELREAVDVEGLLRILEEAAKTGRLPYLDKEGNIKHREIKTKEQLDALETLLRKVLPDLRSEEIEITGGCTVQIISNVQPPNYDLLEEKDGGNLELDSETKEYVSARLPEEAAQCQ